MCLAYSELKWDCQHVQRLKDGWKSGFVTSLGSGISGSMAVVAELREMHLKPAPSFFQYPLPLYTCQFCSYSDSEIQT